MAEVNIENLAETENYAAWKSTEPDGEVVYHVEIGSVTLHFFQEEWDEVVTLISAAGEEEGETDTEE
ncbi:MAG: hypothetical protein SGJ24_05615 [Chloroflexota bacterium]|nr:hypothetical protein [Chloroflexota bacterium]